MALSFTPKVRAERYLVASLLLMPILASAHVELDSPNGAEAIVSGQSFAIQWHPSVLHNTQDWDLWYSSQGAAGPWTMIAADIPYDSEAVVDQVLAYEWSVPAESSSQAWIHVQQDNSGTDYEDVSDASFLLLVGGDFTGEGNVDQSDLTLWESGFGMTSQVIHADGDANVDGDVDGTDFLHWQRDNGIG